MTAIRSVRAAEGKFVQIANEAMQERRLSFTARGILAFVLSLPPDKHLTAEWLETQSADSRRDVRAALRELESLGYYRKAKKSGGRGVWVWDQIMSDAPIGDDDTFTQVSSSDHHTSDVNTSDVKRSDKNLKTTEPKDVDQKMAQERASRRGAASSDAAQRTADQVISDVRRAVVITCGLEDAEALSDGQALGLYFTYCNPKKPARDLVAYLSKILEDSTYVDTLLANARPVCIPCWRYEDDCRCGTPAAA